MNELFDFIKDYGGYAGAASVLGLAVLSLLYFAQAREVKRLREWAGRAPERDAELQARVMAGQARAAQAPQPQPAVARQPVRQPGQPQTAAAQQAQAAKPGAANGAAQPATAVTPGAAAAAAGAAGAAGAAAGAQTPGAKPGTPAEAAKGDDAEKTDGDATTPNGTATPTGDDAKAPEAAAAGTVPPAAPTTPAPNAPAAGATPPDAPTGDTPLPPPRTPGAGRPARPATPRPAPAPAALRQGGAGTRQSRPASVSTQRVGRRFPVGVIAAIAGGVIVLGVVLALVLGGGDESTPERTGGETPAQTDSGPLPSPNAEPKQETRTTPHEPGQVRVAVLNGTTIGGLAATTAEQLRGASYDVGKVDDAEEQNRSATEVRYANGYRGDALEIAKRIDVGDDAVEGGIDTDLSTVAGSDAKVVVTVGSDKSGQQQSGQG